MKMKKEEGKKETENFSKTGTILAFVVGISSPWMYLKILTSFPAIKKLIYSLLFLDPLLYFFSGILLSFSIEFIVNRSVKRALIIGMVSSLFLIFFIVVRVITKGFLPLQ